MNPEKEWREIFALEDLLKESLKIMGEMLRVNLVRISKESFDI